MSKGYILGRYTTPAGDGYTSCEIGTFADSPRGASGDYRSTLFGGGHNCGFDGHARVTAQAWLREWPSNQEVARAPQYQATWAVQTSLDYYTRTSDTQWVQVVYQVRLEHLMGVWATAWTDCSPAGTSVITCTLYSPVFQLVPTADPALPGPPRNDVRPSIAGSTVEGSRLTMHRGSWTGGQPMDSRYQWQACDDAGSSCEDIVGATAETYDLTSEDLDQRMRGVVTASNAGGTVTVPTDPTGVVTPIVPLPEPVRSLEEPLGIEPFSGTPLSASCTASYCGPSANHPLIEAMAQEPALDAPDGDVVAATIRRSNYGIGDSVTTSDGPAFGGKEVLDSSGNVRVGRPDSRFTDLDIRRARLIVPWDVVRRGEPALVKKQAGQPLSQDEAEAAVTLDTTDRWFRAAHRAGFIDVLVSFNGTRGGGPLPSTPAYADGVAKFRSRYAQAPIRYLTAWNEPNWTDWGLTAAQAAEYFIELNKQCGSDCVVLAGDFLDAQYTETYARAYHDAIRFLPKAWAWHAYGSGYGTADDGAGANPRHTNLDNFLNLTRANGGSVWLTEQGGLVTRRESGQQIDYSAPIDPASQLQRQLKLPRVALASQRARLKRFYYYQWKGDLGWDPGLRGRGSDRTLRPTYGILKEKTAR